MFNLGGIEWTFGVQYQGKKAIGEALGDLSSLGDTLKKAAEQSKSFSSSLGETGNANEKIRQTVQTLRELQQELERLKALQREAASGYLSGPNQQQIASAISQVTSAIRNQENALSQLIGTQQRAAFEAANQIRGLNQKVEQDYAIVAEAINRANRSAKVLQQTLSSDTPAQKIERIHQVMVELETQLKKLEQMKSAQSGLLGYGIGDSTQINQAINSTKQALETQQRQIIELIKAEEQERAETLAREKATSQYVRVGRESAKVHQDLKRLMDDERLSGEQLTQVYRTLQNLRLASRGLTAVAGAGVGSPVFNTQALQKASFQYIAQYERAALMVRNFSKAVNESEKEIKREDDAQQKKAQTNQKLGNSFSIAATSVLSFASALGAARLYDFIKEATLLAARVENLGTVANNVGSIMGLTRGTVANLVGSITDLGITTREARSSLALMAQGELDLSQAANLARTAQDAAVIAGLNSSEAFDKIVQSVQQTNTWMLRHMGILVNLNNLYRDFAISEGRIITTLSTHERQQLLLNEVLRKGTAIAGTYESSLADVYKQFTSLDRLTEEARVSFGEVFLPIFEKVVEAVGNFSQWFRKADDSVKIIAATLAAFGAAAFAAASAISGIVVAFSAAALAGGGFGVMLAGLLPVLLAVGAAVLVAGYGITGLAERGIKKAGEEGAAAASKFVYLKKIIDELRATADEETGLGFTEIQTRKIKDNLAQAIRLLPEFQAKLSILDPSKPREIADAIESFAGNLLIDAASRAELLRQQVEVRKKELAKAEDDLAAMGNRGKFGLSSIWKQIESVFNPEGIDTDVYERSSLNGFIQDAREDIAKFEAEIQALDLLPDEIIARQAEGLLKEIETAYNMALRVDNLYNEKRENTWEDTNIKIFQDFSKTMDNLQIQLTEAEDIDRLTESRIKVRLAEIRNAYDENVAAAVTGIKDESLLQERLNELKNQFTANSKQAEAFLRDEASAIKLQIEYVQEIIEKEKELVKLRHTAFEAETALIRRRNELRERGLESSLITPIIELEGLERRYNDSLTNLANIKAKLEEQLAAVRRNITPDLTPDELRKQREAEARILAKLEDLERTKNGIIKRYQEDRVAAEADLQDELIQLEEKRVEAISKLAKAELDISKLVQEEKLRIAAARFEIEKKELAREETAFKNFLERVKGMDDAVAKVREMRKEMAQLIGQGLSPRSAYGQVMARSGLTATQALINRAAALKDILFEPRREGRNRREQQLINAQQDLAGRFNRFNELFRKMVDKGVDPNRAFQQARKILGFDITPEEFKALMVAAKQKGLEDRKKDLERREAEREREEEKRRQEKFQQDIKNAQKTRVDILNELKKIREQLEKANEEKPDAAERAQPQADKPKDIFDELFGPKNNAPRPGAGAGGGGGAFGGKPRPGDGGRSNPPDTPPPAAPGGNPPRRIDPDIFDEIFGAKIPEIKDESVYDMEKIRMYRQVYDDLLKEFEALDLNDPKRAEMRDKLRDLFDTIREMEKNPLIRGHEGPISPPRTGPKFRIPPDPDLFIPDIDMPIDPNGFEDPKFDIPNARDLFKEKDSVGHKLQQDLEAFFDSVVEGMDGGNKRDLEIGRRAKRAQEDLDEAEEAANRAGQQTGLW